MKGLRWLLANMIVLARLTPAFGWGGVGRVPGSLGLVPGSATQQHDAHRSRPQTTGRLRVGFGCVSGLRWVGAGAG